MQGAQPWEVGAGGPLGIRHQTNPFTNIKGSLAPSGPPSLYLAKISGWRDSSITVKAK